ncbi:hypothetical protein [Brevibacillus fulvus]|uniref:Uncharacterized protein n=1 Tax=Brevibacillus fulvus TaxID=1125967 RepID=A0A938Y134_9BACL|nr:hypothetical protein [Brevibacillus fulvus]MBM7590504.1 hypothetical protein [Brevibacillus fulvus]
MNEKQDRENIPLRLFTTKQNMDTPYITEQAEDTYETNQGDLEVDSDVNEDPRRERLLDDSVDAFLDSLQAGTEKNQTE